MGLHVEFNRPQDFAAADLTWAKARRIRAEALKLEAEARAADPTRTLWMVAWVLAVCTIVLAVAVVLLMTGVA